jgi:hypothetical protein
LPLTDDTDRHPHAACWVCVTHCEVDTVRNGTGVEDLTEDIDLP